MEDPPRRGPRPVEPAGGNALGSGALPRAIVVMGVAGAGKTTIGRLLAQRLGWTFHDADDHHPPGNRAKLTAGRPLSDDDRAPWLRRLNQLLRAAADGERVVLACSALTARHRAVLTAGTVDTALVYLRVTPELVRARLAERAHFFNPVLIDDQFATLEEPAAAVVLPAELPPADIVSRIERTLVGERP